MKHKDKFGSIYIEENTCSNCLSNYNTTLLTNVKTTLGNENFCSNCLKLPSVESTILER